MYRIRLHGRGGQGIKTGGRILGSALFAEGFEVQDAPRYGAERRGAPLFAYVRAAHRPIHERGAIAAPDLVVVADETLVPVAAAGVLAGVGPRTLLLIASRESADAWRQRLRLAGPVLALSPATEGPGELRYIGATCAGAAARALGVVRRASLEAAIRAELADMSESARGQTLARALGAFDAFAPHAGCVAEGPDATTGAPGDPGWVEIPFEPADVSAPAIRGSATSVEVRTGLWRTMRPVLDREACHRCTWVCTTFCPDGAIAAGPDGFPQIDLDHCKGCLVCVAVCAPHAIRAVPEAQAARGEA
jgi:pyruvate ferredoxin oxidoreductase gamma subunit